MRRRPATTVAYAVGSSSMVVIFGFLTRKHRFLRLKISTTRDEVLTLNPSKFECEACGRPEGQIWRCPDCYGGSPSQAKYLQDSTPAAPHQCPACHGRGTWPCPYCRGNSGCDSCQRTGGFYCYVCKGDRFISNQAYASYTAEMRAERSATRHMVVVLDHRFMGKERYQAIEIDERGRRLKRWIADRPELLDIKITSDGWKPMREDYSVLPRYWK